MSDLPQQTRRCYRHRAGLWWWECLPPQLQCRPWHLPSPALQSRHRERSPPDARWGGGGWGGLCAGVGGGWRWSGGLSPAPTCAGWCRPQESDPARRADPRRSGLPRTLQRGQLCNQSELTSACRIIAWRGARVEKEKTGEISTSSPHHQQDQHQPHLIILSSMARLALSLCLEEELSPRLSSRHEQAGFSRPRLILELKLKISKINKII